MLTAVLHFGAYAQDLSTEIKAATVYRSEAYIERSVRMEIQKGTATLNFTGLPQGIDLESIKVKASPEFQVLDIRPEQRSLEHDSIKLRSIKLEADYKNAVRTQKKMRSEWDILKREESVLLNNTSFKGEQNGSAGCRIQSQYGLSGTESSAFAPGDDRSAGNRRTAIDPR